MRPYQPSGLSWKRAIFRPEDLRPGPFSIHLRYSFELNSMGIYNGNTGIPRSVKITV